MNRPPSPLPSFRFTIRLALQIFFFVIFAITLTSSGVILWSNHQATQLANTLLLSSTTANKIFTALRTSLSRLEEDIFLLHRAQHEKDQEHFQRLTQRTGAHLEEIRSLTSLLPRTTIRQWRDDPLTVTDEERFHPREIHRLSRFLQELNLWLEALRTSEEEFRNVQETESHIQVWLQDVLPPLSRELQRVQTLAEQNLDHGLSHIRREIHQSTRVAWVMVGLALVSVFLISWLLASRINQAIDKLQNTVHGMESGHLDTALEFSLPFHELAQLAASFNHMATRLNQTLISRSQLDGILMSIAECILVLDYQGYVRMANDAAGQLLGIEKEVLHNRLVTSFFRDQDPAQTFLRYCLQELLEIREVEAVWLTGQGREVLVNLTITSLNTMLATEDIRLVLVARDISRQREYETSLLQQRNFTRLLLESTQEGIYGTDMTGHCTFVNQAAAHMLGYQVDELLGHPMHAMIHHSFPDGAPYPVSECPVHGAMESQHGFRSDDEVLWRKDRTPLPVSFSTHPIVEYGKVTGAVVLFGDITQRKNMEAQLRHLASHDPLTGLPNRTLFADRLQHAKKRANRRNTLLGLFFISLDGIKAINDTFGHAVGDQVLRTVAQRCQTVLRHADTVARFGGNEFIVLAEDAHSVQSLIDLIVKVQDYIHGQAIEVDGRQLSLTSRIGGVIYPFIEEESQLLRAADIAMHHAERSAQGTFCFYDSAMGKAHSRRILVEKALVTALQQDEFQLYLQPKQRLASGEVQEVEALLRLNSSELGSVSPGEFIPVAEESGHILAIGDWVVERACRMLAGWRQLEHPMPAIAVNVSARQFQQAGFMDRFINLLETYQIGHHQLGIEITESVLMDNLVQTAPVLFRLQRLGIHLAVDDFGTGHSSLAYLKQLPINTLKIDRSFVRDLPNNTHDVAIVEAILAMARHLGLKTVAEGVETAQQMDFLRSRNCDELQGFLFARPMPEEELLRFLEDKKVLPPGT